MYLQHVSVTIVCVLWVNSLKSKFPEICFCTYDNSFRILNNFLMTCVTKHKFAKANVFSVKGII